MPPVSLLLALTWRVFKDNASIFLGYSAWILIPYILLIARVETPLPSGLATTLTVLLYLIQGVLIIWATSAMAIVTFAVLRKKEVQLGALGKRAWQFVWPVIVVEILTALVTLGGLILFVIPAFIFAIWYAFAQFEVILHKKRGWAALTGSHDLVRGRFWNITWSYLGGQLFLLLCYFFATAILTALIALLLGSPESAFSFMQPPLWQDVLFNILEMLVLPLFVIYQTAVYLEAVGSREEPNGKHQTSNKS